MKKLLLATCAAFAVSSGASAAIIPVLDTVTPVGPDFEFSYSGTLAGDQGLVPGSQLIIYDFAGYVDGSISSGIYAADLAATVEFTSALLPPPSDTDDPLVPNLVFTWTGAPFNAAGGPFADVSFAGLTAHSIYSAVQKDGFSAKAVTNNGAATGDEAFNIGRVGVPMASVVPEPAAWALMILGFGVAGASLRARRRLAVA
ncbi:MULTISPECIES: PEPxxWA-CTERM sorting domain-containing protein [Phenylobacterium]|uniref:Ice-binding protein C-terminal domain-containing protein n=1 Tax=Phenylobacterium koreense TaxID=266125 RepID=A0ABV2EEC6_9CAUL